MSSDGYFEGSDFDDAALEQIDAIEAAAFQSPPKPSRPTPLTKEPSLYDMSFDIDESELSKLDEFIEDAYQGKAQPVAGPSKGFNRTSSSNMLQTTLYGDILPSQPQTSRPRPPIQRTKSVPRNPFGQQAPKKKYWDHTAFAQSGSRRKKVSKGKGKAKAGNDEDEGDFDDEEDVEFEQFPAPFIPGECQPVPPPMKLKLDLLEAKHWVYPTNRAKRDYQFNIVKHCLFENTLVALPTGLGKTFIGGVVMLNYYRWFPEGKIVFVAPTKPLVAQQITACHETCGIPGSDGIELTGNVQAHTRERYWKEKRVFYMTPQTFERDLETRICNPEDIILFVIDEAHHATGDYSYNKLVRFLMAKNPHFRVLALTATPGNTRDAVQGLIDGLHISRIEIRNETSLDLKPYIYEKVIKPHIIKPNDGVNIIKDLLVKAMDPLIQPLKTRKLLFPSETALTLHPFRPQMLSSKLDANQKSLYGPLSQLSILSRGMMYLLTGSISACHEYFEGMKKMAEEDALTDKKVTKNKALLNNPNFQKVMLELNLMRQRGYPAHPKMEKLKNILIQYFGARIGEPSADITKPDDTRVMVFSSYRSVVEQIVTELEQERPLIRAAAFVGQATSNKGVKGLTQKEQLKLIEQFKAGEHNVLVATCIGEEGLDIGEIDVTICYDTDKAPTRMVQRFGRTGRKRAGEIHALLAEAREEFNLDKAKDTYKEVQKTITRGEHYELYADVPRLLPDHIKPECLEKVMEIQEYVREEPRKRKPAVGGKNGVKRKRNDDPGRNIPIGASTNFVSVKDLIVASKSKKIKVIKEKDFELMGQDDEKDEDIESGSILAPPRRAQSEKPKGEKRSKTTKLRKAATIGGSKDKVSKSRKKKKTIDDLTSSQLARQGVDDSDDMDIESGTVVAPPFSRASELVTLGETSVPSTTSSRSPSRKTPEHDITDLSETESEQSTRASIRRGETPISTSSQPEQKSKTPENMGWLVDDDDDMFEALEIVDSSPLVPKKPAQAFERIEIGDESIEITQPVSINLKRRSSSHHSSPNDFLQDLNSDDAVVGHNPSWSPSPKPGPSLTLGSVMNASFLNPSETSVVKLSTSLKSSNPMPFRIFGKEKLDMPPPQVPCRRSWPSPTGEQPEPTFPVRRAKRRRIISDIPGSPDLDENMPPSSQRRLHREIESTPPQPLKQRKRYSKKAKPSLLAKKPNPLFDGEAAHSGDEVSEGYSEEEDEESESDRAFLINSPVTQVSPSYDQALAYRQSLLTQAPTMGKLPVFATNPVRPRPFGRISPSRKRGLPSSSPPPPDEEPDEYAFGSFIVKDDADLLYLTNSDDW